MSTKIMPIDFEEQLRSIAITTSPMHFTDERPEFMSPKPTSPKRKPVAVRPASSSPLPSALGKRDFIIAFGDDAEEQRYGQKIEGDFFATNVGHGVFSPVEQKPSAPAPASATTPASGLTAEQMHAAADSVIQDFRADLSGLLRRERDSESKYDVDEILAWCEYYKNNRNLFNV
jgi:hypothetical protein